MKFFSQRNDRCIEYENKVNKNCVREPTNTAAKKRACLVLCVNRELNSVYSTCKYNNIYTPRASIASIASRSILSMSSKSKSTSRASLPSLEADGSSSNKEQPSYARSNSGLSELVSDFLPSAVPLSLLSDVCSALSPEAVTRSDCGRDETTSARV